MTEMKTSEAIEMINRCKHEIMALRRQIDHLQSKADAYDKLAAVQRLLPNPPVGMSNDLIWQLDKRIRELESKEEVRATPAPKEEE